MKKLYSYIPRDGARKHSGWGVETPHDSSYGLNLMSAKFQQIIILFQISRSGPKEVTLRGVRRELTGDYKCEVSADAPLFHTEIKSSHMAVAELPSENPSMNIDHPKVEIGKQIGADCIASGSDPAANLTWFINDEQ
ncbi:hypothetical protein ILUMI_03273, partial [Ignelater luminosus]